MVMRTHLLLLLVAACSSTPPPEHPGSRGARADDHLAAADAHADRANQLAMWPDQRPGDGSPTTNTPGRWYRTWDTAREQRRFAQEHRAQAAQITAAYEEACGNRPTSEVSISPLQRYGIGGAPTTTGAMIFLSPDAGTADGLLADLRCHRAWMMLGRSDMDSCPLDLAGIKVEAHGDTTGITVEISIDDPKLVPELQRRAAVELEAAHHATTPH